MEGARQTFLATESSTHPGSSWIMSLTQVSKGIGVHAVSVIIILLASTCIDFFVKFFQKNPPPSLNLLCPCMAVCFKTIKVKKGTWLSACGIPPLTKKQHSLHQRDHIQVLLWVHFHKQTIQDTPKLEAASYNSALSIQLHVRSSPEH